MWLYTASHLVIYHAAVCGPVGWSGHTEVDAVRTTV